jgi:type II secretory pathway pseudopilin PulG
MSLLFSLPASVATSQFIGNEAPSRRNLSLKYFGFAISDLRKKLPSFYCSDIIAPVSSWEASGQAPARQSRNGGLARVSQVRCSMFDVRRFPRASRRIGWDRSSIVPRLPITDLPLATARRAHHHSQLSLCRPSQWSVVSSPWFAFTLLELIVVLGSVAILIVLVAPAFTKMKRGTDITSAAYTVKGVLDTAGTYAKANNTYTWVGFAGSIGSAVTGNVALAIVASKDGTDLGTSVNITGSRIDITARVTPIGKVMRLDNSHIGDTGPPTNDGTDFENRPPVNINYRLGAAGTGYDSDYYFIEQQTQFDRWIRFSPRGEAVVKGGDTQIARYAEVGVLPTHGTALALTPNIVAIQISGFGGDVRIYRR